jgi:hypothetical protein
MNRIQKNLVFILMLLIQLPALGISIVSNDNSWGGRFGDKLSIYYRAKWLSYKYGLPFYFQPFQYQPTRFG